MAWIYRYKQGWISGPATYAKLFERRGRPEKA